MVMNEMVVSKHSQTGIVNTVCKTLGVRILRHLGILAEQNVRPPIALFLKNILR